MWISVVGIWWTPTSWGPRVLATHTGDLDGADSWCWLDAALGVVGIWEEKQQMENHWLCLLSKSDEL